MTNAIFQTRSLVRRLEKFWLEQAFNNPDDYAAQTAVDKCREAIVAIDSYEYESDAFRTLSNLPKPDEVVVIWEAPGEPEIAEFEGCVHGTTALWERAVPVAVDRVSKKKMAQYKRRAAQLAPAYI